VKKTNVLLVLFGIIFLILSCEKQSEVTANNQASYDNSIAKGFEKNKLQQLDSAFFYFNKATEFAYNEDSKVYALFQMAAVQLKVGDFFGTEETTITAFKQSKSTLYHPYLYNILGIAFLEQNNFNEAIENYNKIYNDTLNDLDKAIIKNNIAVVYLEKKEFQKAIEIEEALLTYKDLQTDKLNYAKVLDNLGYAYFKTNNPNALPLLNQSKTLRDSINNDYEKIATYIHLAEYHQATNPNVALQMANDAFTFANNTNNPDDKLEALKLKIELSNPTTAKTVALQHIQLSDSIFKVRQFAKNQFAKIKYDASKAELEKDKSEKQKQIIFWILVAVAIIAINIILIIRYRNKQKLKASVYDTEIRISKKIHDELANDVFQAMTYAETQDLQNNTKKEALLDALENIYTLTRDISQSNSQIDTTENYKEQLFELLNNFNSATTNVILKTDDTINWDKLNKEIKITLHRVLQELMVNMKKHSNCSIVVITFINHPKQLEIKYADNGQGINPQTFDKKGLQNVENRIQTLKGTIIFDNETHKGFKVTISIPK
jgi:signal transduction histidine kinase